MSKTNFEFLDALGQIARDKGISVETLLDALANALVAAYKRRPDAAEEAVVTIDPDSGEIRVYGQELNEEGEVVREWDDTPDDFGRIAAQTAKQVILQRIREVERDMKYEEYAGPRGRHRHRASSSRPTTATRCSTWARSRRCCPRPSRSPTSATSTGRASRPTSSRSARRPRAPRSWSAAPTPA